ncbi:MAG: ketoacyl-ACP synthase III [Solirubrobacteraceae bacterium]
MRPTWTIEGIEIPAIAAALPSTAIDNARIAADSGDPDYVQRISDVVGVRSRRVVDDGEFGSDLAARAARAVVEHLGWGPDDIDVLIVGTQTPDRLFPGIAFSVQQALDLSKDCAVFDINLGCSAFVYGAWMMASTLPRPHGRGLLVTVDTMSRTLDAGDVGNRVLFGDGAAAAAFETTPDGSVLNVALSSDGRGADFVCLPGTAMSTGLAPAEGFQLNGPAVLGLALRSVPKLIGELLETAGTTLSDVGLVVPHQANEFILEKLRDRMKIPADRFVIAMDETGNTSSASIPIALSDDRVRNAGHDRSATLMVGFGTGLSWGAILADLSRTALLGFADPSD